MTSFIVEAHVDRPVHPEWADNPDCVFCQILGNKLPSYTLYEDDKVIAVLGGFLYDVVLRVGALSTVYLDRHSPTQTGTYPCGTKGPPQTHLRTT